MRTQNMARGMALAALLAAAAADHADARNPHCSGGILYVTQAIRDRDKGDRDGYERQIRKAVLELEQCASEDPADAEALSYLGWAYAEVDSAGPAGRAFAAAIAGLTAKGDKKKADLATSNRHSYWVRAFNDGVTFLKNAGDLEPEWKKYEARVVRSGSATPLLYTFEAGVDTTGTAYLALVEYNKAVRAFERASLLKPNDPQTLRNLGSVMAQLGDFQSAEKVLKDGLATAPDDSLLKASFRVLKVSRARSLADAKKFDEAIAGYNDLIKAEPELSEHHLALGEALFARAQSKAGDARKPDFVLAADAYARAAELKPSDADLPFNAALAYQNAGAWGKAEAQWRLAEKLRPDDVEVRASLGAVLAEQKKFVEAIKTVHAAVLLKPDNKTLHRQLGSIYTKAGNNGKGTEELMVYLAMHSGQPAPDPAAAVKGARPESAAGKTLASDGTPDQVITWTADKDTYDTWFYWGKKRAYTFKLGTLVTKSDWSAADLTVTAAAGSGK
jgi:tetratricopeptide (TPR) repeat protein